MRSGSSEGGRRRAGADRRDLSGAEGVAGATDGAVVGGAALAADAGRVKEAGTPIDAGAETARAASAGAGAATAAAVVLCAWTVMGGAEGASRCACNQPMSAR